MFGFPVFGGSSPEAQKRYFDLKVLEGDARNAPQDINYPEQWLRELRVTFDNGVTITNWDAQLTGSIPPGAKRIERIEMDFGRLDSPPATLVWAASK
jgi:hypothetical protein